MLYHDSGQINDPNAVSFVSIHIFLAEFTSLTAMFNALESRSLDGVLLDSFVAGASRSIISSNVRVNKIMSYDSSYGIVFRGEMASPELQTCFNNYVSNKKGEISHTVEEGTTPVEVHREIFTNHNRRHCSCY